VVVIAREAADKIAKLTPPGEMPFMRAGPE
jgi:hypothetical protein